VPAEIAFDLTLPHGRCLAVRIPGAGPALDDLIATALAPAEQARAASFPVPRRRTFTGGRAAARELLQRMHFPQVAVASDDRGAPVFPPGVAGSITHKEGLAAALVGHESTARLGVDLEPDVAHSQDISSRVLTAAELAELAALDPLARAREVLLRFSAKEAVYKALDPYVRRYVGFLEIAVSPRQDGTALVTSHLPETEGPFVIDVRWQRFEGIVLTTARVTRP
jgi:enterobactin synthetase component D